MKTKRFLLIVTMLIIISIQTYADQVVYEIRSAEFFSEGRTLPYFLENAAEIEIGRQFTSTDDLKDYIEDRKQFLLNQRVLASVLISSLTGIKEGDIIPVDLKISTTDTWNIIALPYGKYDSNTGFLLSVRARNYNFLGTMETLRINLNWEQDTDSNISWGADASFVYPFSVFKYDWIWNVDTVLTLSDTGTDYSLCTGITMYIPTKMGKVAIFGDQGINVNGSGTEYTANGDALYFTESAGASISVPLYTIPFYGDIKWTPSVKISQKWDYDGLQTEDLNGLDLNISHSLGFGRIDWEENFRKGYSMSVSNSNSLDIQTGTWGKTISFSNIAHTNWQWAGISSKFSGFYRFDSTDTSAGDPVRGILNDRIDADAALFLNLDLPVRVIRFLPSEWFGTGWMKLFNFEQHWSPFVDMAWSHLNGQSTNSDNFWYGGGIEVITYPLIMRSIYLRINAGWDLKDVVELKTFSGEKTIFVGLGHHY